MSSKKRRSSGNRDRRLIGILVVVGAAAAVAGILTAAALTIANRPTYSSAEVDASKYYNLESAAPRPLLSIVGDSYTGGSSMNQGDKSTWPHIVSESLDVRIQPLARGGSGYVNEHVDFPGQNFTTKAFEVDPAADVVVFFGSRNDGDRADEVREASARAFATTRELAPAATLIVVAPAWVNESVPDGLFSTRDALAASAADAGAVFVDPLAEGWFFGENASLIGEDGVHPTNEGHAYLAQLISDRIAPLLPAR